MKTRERILNESIKLFAENGYEGTSMVSIANIIGVTKPSLYAHFDNKSALFEACLDKIAQDQIEFIEKTLGNPKYNSVEQKLYSILNDCTLIDDKYSVKFYNRFNFLPPVELKELVSAKLDVSTMKWTEMLFDVISKAIESGEIDKSLTKEEIVSSYVCIMNGTGFYSESYKNLNQIWKVFWKGIRA